MFHIDSRIQIIFCFALEIFISLVFVCIFVLLAGTNVVLRTIFVAIAIVGSVLVAILWFTMGKWTAASREKENRFDNFCNCQLRLLVEWIYDHSFGGKIFAAVVIVGWIIILFVQGADTPLSRCATALVFYWVFASIIFVLAEDPIKQLQRENADADADAE